MGKEERTEVDIFTKSLHSHQSYLNGEQNKQTLTFLVLYPEEGSIAEMLIQYEKITVLVLQFPNLQ